jgi:predicted PurR-regulated permease PerM
MVAQKIEITTNTILRTILYLIGFWFLFKIRLIVVTIFVAFILMTAISPIVKAARRIKIPTLVVVAAVFIGIIALLTTLVVSLAPAVVAETTGLVQNFPTYIQAMNERWSITLDQSLLTEQLNNIPSNVLHFAAGAFGNVLTIMAVFFMTYYLSIERTHLHEYVKHILSGEEREKRAEALVADIERRVGGWVRGELFLMTIIGVMSYIGLMILHIPYALPLAILAGLLEAVPSIGPTISTIPAIMLGLSISPLTGLGALAMAIIIQQSENNLIVPKVMQHVIGVRPIVTIVVLMTGFTLGGVIGAVLAMPVFLMLTSVYKELHILTKEEV